MKGHCPETVVPTFWHSQSHLESVCRTLILRVRESSDVDISHEFPGPVPGPHLVRRRRATTEHFPSGSPATLRPGCSRQSLGELWTIVCSSSPQACETVISAGGADRFQSSRSDSMVPSGRDPLQGTRSHTRTTTRKLWRRGGWWRWKDSGQAV